MSAERGVLGCGPVKEHAAASPVCCGVKSGSVLVRSFKAVCCEQCVNELRAAGLNALVIDAQTLKSVRTGVGDENVGGLEQLEQSFLAFGIFEVQAEAVLVAVVGLENGSVVLSGGNFPCAADCAVGFTLCCFKLYNVCAPFGHYAACNGSGNMSSELYDFDVLKRFHGFLLTKEKIILKTAGDTH